MAAILPSAESPVNCDKKWQNESENNKVLNYKDFYIKWKVPTYMEISRDNDQKRKQSPYM